MDEKNLNDDKNLSDVDKTVSDKKISDGEMYSVEDSEQDDLYAKSISLDKPSEISDEPTNLDESQKVSLDKKIPDKPTKVSAESPKFDRPRTFHSRHFMQEQEEIPDKKRKRKLSHAETSGVAISAVMMIYSLTEQDKPLFFASAALIIFLLRSLIGALCGKHNQAVQNALHTFSLVLFIGALVMLFL